MPPNIPGINSIIVIGKPGSGKSVMVWFLGALLDEDGYRVKFYSDRLGLEEGVLDDIKGVKKDKEGIKTGKHSRLIADGPPGHRKVHVLDGFILNKVHDHMIRDIKQHRKKHEIIIGEYATGPVINFGKGKIPLYQSAGQLIKLIRKYKTLKSVFILDIEAGLPIREARESKRPDAMAPETFKAYFPDGGEMSSGYKKWLGGHYRRIINHDEDHEGYFSEARYVYEVHIRPYLI